MNEQRLTLLELNSLVRQLIETAMPREYWVEAELSECRESRGHCYMELTQRDDRAATPIARASAKCWASKWALIRPFFERATGQQLRAGMKVLLRVYAQFHEAYGFSWIVTDIDPTYTLGDQARRRQEIINQLKKEGVFDLQRELTLPLFCMNIAVISSRTAAGYGDFCNQLAESPFAFRTQLFPAVMQGEGIEQSVISALEQVWASAAFVPDVVVIIRGGGATSDMSGFDTLALAENVANFPIPVITGIGHDRDECILDMVAHQRVKTPTAAAALLIAHLSEVLDTVDDAQKRITIMAQQRITALQAQLSTISEMLPRIFSSVRTRQEARIDNLYTRLTGLCQQKILTLHASVTAIESKMPFLLDRRLRSEHHRLEMLTEKTKALDPIQLLHRGYSITTKDGHAVRDASLLKPGDTIETRLANGSVCSTVKSP